MAEHSRWLPILVFFQGARLTELGQLHRTDVRKELGIRYLAPITLSDEDGRLLPGWSCHSIPPQIFDPAQLVYDAPWREHAG
jgi:hypothetical protein